MSDHDIHPTRERLMGEIREYRDKLHDLTKRLESRDSEIAELWNKIETLEHPLEGRSGVLNQAIAALHEQAHGPESVRFCGRPPCRELGIEYRGPVPLSMMPL